MYYGHKFTVDTRQFVRTCDVCQRSPGTDSKLRAMLESVMVSGHVVMDILELTPTGRGNRYDLVISNYYIRRPEAFALPGQKEETVKRAFVEVVISRNGSLSVLHSDKGPNIERVLVNET